MSRIEYGILVDYLRGAARWFVPGLGVKRWFLFVLAGTTLLGVGFAIFLLDLYRTDSTNPILLALLSYLSLRFLPRIVRVLIFGGIGVWLITYGIIRLNRSLMKPFLRPGHAVVDELSEFRRLERSPRIVAIGGGHGLATLLRSQTTHATLQQSSPWRTTAGRRDV
jgi:hypothetical protein